MFYESISSNTAVHGHVLRKYFIQHCCSRP